MCERFKCLPYPGSLLEQPADFIKMVKIFDLGKPEGKEGGEENAQ